MEAPNGSPGIRGHVVCCAEDNFTFERQSGSSPDLRAFALAKWDLRELCRLLGLHENLLGSGELKFACHLRLALIYELVIRFGAC